jgi:hypothetical protein
MTFLLKYTFLDKERMNMKKLHKSLPGEGEEWISLLC